MKVKIIYIIKLILTATIFVAYSVNSATYTLVDIGTHPGGNNSSAFDVNNSRNVVGRSNDGSQTHAFIWNSSDGIQDIGTLGGYSILFSINNSNQAVGYSTNNQGADRAFVWDVTNGILDLGILNGGTFSQANSINDNGIVVGYADNSQTATAFSWDATFGLQGIAIQGSTISNAFDINNNGHITGDFRNANSNTHGFLLSNNTTQDLGIFNGGSFFQPHGINSTNQIVGHYFDSNSNGLAFKWDNSTGFQDLGTLGDFSVALDINDNNIIVGYYVNSNSQERAFLWDNTNGMQDLCELVNCKTSGWTSLNKANGINDNGDIVGFGEINGENHAFILTTNADNSSNNSGSGSGGGSLYVPYLFILTIILLALRSFRKEKI